MLNTSSSAPVAPIHYAPLSDLLKALSHSVRLAILDVLARDEACVCHLMALLGLRQPAVSQHLMVLRNAGLVRDRREGLMVHYRLADARLTGLVALAVDLLRAQGQRVTLPEIPSGPLAGCPCPYCSDSSP